MLAIPQLRQLFLLALAILQLVLLWEQLFLPEFIFPLHLAAYVIVPVTLPVSIDVVTVVDTVTELETVRLE